MWDLTVPGDNDHDFYIRTSATSVLVHNECSDKLADFANEHLGRTNVAAEVTNANGATGYGVSQARTAEDLTEQVRVAAEATEHHMGCAEIGGLCDLESQGEPLTGLGAQAVKVAGGTQGHDLAEHLEDFGMCSSCRRLFNYLNGG